MTNKAHYAVIAGELAPVAKVSDAQFSKIPDLIRASFQALNRLVPEESKLKYEIIRMDEFLAFSESPTHSMRSVIMLNAWSSGFALGLDRWSMPRIT